MEQRDLEVLAQFEEVWLRVQRGSRTEARSDTDELCALLDGLQYQYKGCRQLAACAHGAEKKRLLALSNQTKKQLQRVQLHYFLKESDVYISTATPNFASYTPYNLRKLWQSTVENAEMIENCNLKGDSLFVAELGRIKEEIECQKIDIEKLIGRLLQ